MYTNYTSRTTTEILEDPKHPAIFPTDNLAHRCTKAARFFAFTRQISNLNVPGDVASSIHAITLKQQYEKIRVRLPTNIRNYANTLPDDPGDDDEEIRRNLRQL